jgi:hypothetical protein
MNAKNQKSNRIIVLLPYILFFFLSTFFFSWFANYIFFYQEKSSLFQVSFPYLLKHLNQPGGFLQYLGELQTTFYYHSLVGAVMVSLEICLVILLVSGISKVLTGRSVYFVPFVIGAALFYMQTNYQYSGLNNLGILLQIALFYLAVTYLRGKGEWVMVFLFPAWYFLTGSFSLLFFVLFLTYLLVKYEKDFWKKIIILIGVSLLFFYLAQKYFFFQTINTLLVYPFSAQEIGGQLTWFVPVVIFISLLSVLFTIHPGVLNRLRNKRIPWIELSPLLVIAGLVLLAPSRIDKKNSHYFYVEKLFYKHKYNEIIAFNTQFPSNNILTNYLNNIALAETGQLNDELFRFPQSPDGSTLFLKWELLGEVLRQGGYFYYTLGITNEAQRWAYEYMVMRGNTPEGIKMLIKTELINGNYKVAAKYISILKKSVYYRTEALRFEKMLFNDAAVNADVELGSKRHLKPKHDFFVLSDDPAANIDLILAADSTNKMAVEYKFALLMLQKDLPKIASELPLLEKAGFTRIPRNIEEAAVACKLLKMAQLPELKYLKLTANTEQRFTQYYKIFQQNSSNKLQAQKALSRNFSDTFWYYVFFR